MRPLADRSGIPAVTIDAAALRDNLAIVRRLAPRSRIMAVIKANAYGHGLVPVARVLVAAARQEAGRAAAGHAADGPAGQAGGAAAWQSSRGVSLGVARLEEALALREAGIQAPVVLLEGVVSAAQLQSAAHHEVQIVVHCDEQLRLLERCGGGQRFKVWLKLDTGMNRLGFRMEEFAAAHARLAACPVVAKLRLMTHLACADEPDSAFTRAQLQAFASATEALGLQRSIANSAGLIAWPQSQLEWVRPGLMLYGLSPFAWRSAASLGLRAAMTLSTRLIALQRLAAGEAVGYGATWRAPHAASIGIAAIGYGDGYPRGMRNGAPVLVDGHEARIVGRVSMDMCAIDVTALPQAHIGSTVTLWGEGLPAEQVAGHADTIGYELLCRVSQRVRRRWRE